MEPLNQKSGGPGVECGSGSSLHGSLGKPVLAWLVEARRDVSSSALGSQF